MTDPYWTRFFNVVGLAIMKVALVLAILFQLRWLWIALQK